MKSVIAMFAVLSFSYAASASNPYYEIKKVQVREIADPNPAAALAVVAFDDCGSNRPMAATPAVDLNPLEQAGIYLDVITNLGKKVFAIIAQGTPVVNFKTDVATAMPMGVKCWSDLTNWNIPTSKVYRVTYENGFGMTVVDFSYRVIATTGGSFNGKGQYITHATIQPAMIDVAWGFTFNAQADIPTVFNRGTKENPVAGMQMNMKWSVDTPIAHNEQTESYFVGGNNVIVQMQ